jgi:hypothetical protein
MATNSGGFRQAYGAYNDEEYMFDDDMDYVPPARKKPAFGGKERPTNKRPTPAHSPPPGAGGLATSPKAVRSRPTNNQLL